mmetsp:Transcript_7564/g.26965  ORF Transcript_7564/g.26965 Transcript_7564/m.26965 type:complete len:470 (+) Transcript_7564:179-1588(+)
MRRPPHARHPHRPRVPARTARQGPGAGRRGSEPAERRCAEAVRRNAAGARAVGVAAANLGRHLLPGRPAGSGGRGRHCRARDSWAVLDVAGQDAAEHAAEAHGRRRRARAAVHRGAARHPHREAVRVDRVLHCAHPRAACDRAQVDSEGARCVGVHHLLDDRVPRHGRRRHLLGVRRGRQRAHGEHGVHGPCLLQRASVSAAAAERDARHRGAGARGAAPCRQLPGRRGARRRGRGGREARRRRGDDGRGHWRRRRDVGRGERRRCGQRRRPDHRGDAGRHVCVGRGGDGRDGRGRGWRRARHRWCRWGRRRRRSVTVHSGLLAKLLASRRTTRPVLLTRRHALQHVLGVVDGLCRLALDHKHVDGVIVAQLLTSARIAHVDDFHARVREAHVVVKEDVVLVQVGRVHEQELAKRRALVVDVPVLIVVPKHESAMPGPEQLVNRSEDVGDATCCVDDTVVGVDPREADA